MHKHRQGLYGSHSRVHTNHNARGWPQKDARSQLSVQKAMQGEAGFGGVGCRAVDGWTREKGASRCLKPLTATKTADPRTGTDSEELRGGLHWSQKASPQQTRPTELSFMGPGNRKCKRYIFPHVIRNLKSIPSNFLQDTVLWQCCATPQQWSYSQVYGWMKRRELKKKPNYYFTAW